jgi:phosphatidate cytidylyltransferase
MKYARELTAVVAAAPAIWIIGWSPALVFDVTISACALLALYELLVLGRKKGFHPPVVLCLVVAAFILVAFMLESISVEMGVFVALLVIPASYIFMQGSLEEALPSSAIAVMATLYIGMLGGSMIRLRSDFPGDGPKLIFFLLLVVWLGDAGAYYTGKTFGRHKLSPRISPNKTVEGLVGGIVTSVIAAMIIHFTFFPNFPLLHAIIAGVILSFSGVIGDLAESVWKRSADVKDSGTLIPGHGGFLDRFDSIFFTAPILYAYWHILKHGLTSLNIMQG